MTVLYTMLYKACMVVCWFTMQYGFCIAKCLEASTSISHCLLSQAAGLVMLSAESGCLFSQAAARTVPACDAAK